MRSMPRAALLAFLLCGAAPIASAQSVQYRSPAGVEYRAQADTGPVARAERALAAEPRNVDRIIALGVAQSGARQFREAIATFTRGLAIAPGNPMLYRWRGHRHLSVREFDRAMAEMADAPTPVAVNASAIDFAADDFVPNIQALLKKHGFDPARPPSLLYRRDAKGRMQLVGAMYTAPADASPEELDARVPLAMARWHLHVNICTPQPVWDREAWARRKNGQLVFGPASPIATRAECEKEGGRFHPRLFGWMVHVNAFESDPWGQEHAKGGHSH